MLTCEQSRINRYRGVRCCRRTRREALRPSASRQRCTFLARTQSLTAVGDMLRRKSTSYLGGARRLHHSGQLAALADEKAARWRSGRPRQLGKSSQPIETKWGDFAPVGKKALRNQIGSVDSCAAANCRHSMTSSERAWSVGGMSISSALAVLRLITSSNVVGCITGRSAGLTPLSIRPAYMPAWRCELAIFVP